MVRIGDALSIPDSRDGARADTADAVRAWLATAAQEMPVAADVAAGLGLHMRTLERRLAREGTTLRRLLSERRLHAACLLLAHTDAPLGLVARHLGYADATAFGRAFRRWSGTTPDAWRRTRPLPARTG